LETFWGTLGGVTRGQQRVQWLTDLIRLEIMLWDRVDAALKRQHGLPLSSFETMYMIDQAPGAALRVGDLAQRMRVTAGAASKLADRIERTGWIRRDADPDDRRVSRLVLTDDGRSLLEAATRTYADDLAGALDPVLGDHDQQQLHDLVRQLLDHRKQA
jgi:DNA-binding MarR family transcriptional regulator